MCITYTNQIQLPFFLPPHLQHHYSFRLIICECHALERTCPIGIWLIHCNMMFLISPNFQKWHISVLLWLYHTPFCVWIYMHAKFSFIHLSLAWSHILAIVNSESVCMGMQTSIFHANLLPFGHVPRSRKTESQNNSVFNFWHSSDWTQGQAYTREAHYTSVICPSPCLNYFWGRVSLLFLKCHQIFDPPELSSYITVFTVFTTMPSLPSLLYFVLGQLLCRWPRLNSNLQSSYHKLISHLYHVQLFVVSFSFFIVLNWRLNTRALDLKHWTTSPAI